MNPKPEYINAKCQKKLLLSGFAVCALLACATIILITGRSSQILSTNGFPPGTVGEILLETKGATNIIPFENDITHEMQRARDALVPLYVVTASMHMPKDEYRDFIFAIDKSGKKLAVITDGFHAGDKFSLSLDSNIIHDRINADWSGRLEMNTILPVDSKNAKACIKVDGKEDSIDVCHIITGAKSS